MAWILACVPNLFLRRWKFFRQMKPVDFPGKKQTKKKSVCENLFSFLWNLLYLNNACHPPWAMSTLVTNTEISILLANRNFQIAKFMAENCCL